MKYCKDCKWYYPKWFTSPFDCRVINKKIITCFGKYQEENAICSQQNRDYDCKNYKRKWYKFWGKKK